MYMYILSEEQAGEIACSLAMKADATATQTYLATTFTPAAAVDGVRDGELPLPKMPPHGPLHEALRPVVKHMNVQWTSTCGMAFFVMLCSRCVLLQHCDCQVKSQFATVAYSIKVRSLTGRVTQPLQRFGTRNRYVHCHSLQCAYEAH
jgi:hypothetical protein